MFQKSDVGQLFYALLILCLRSSIIRVKCRPSSNHDNEPAVVLDSVDITLSRSLGRNRSEQNLNCFGRERCGVTMTAPRSLDDSCDDLLRVL